MLSILAEYGLQINYGKCGSVQEKVNFIRLEVTADGIRPLKKKVFTHDKLKRIPKDFIADNEHDSVGSLVSHGGKESAEESQIDRLREESGNTNEFQMTDLSSDDKEIKNERKIVLELER